MVDQPAALGAVAGEEVGDIAHDGHGGSGDEAHALDLLRVLGRAGEAQHGALGILHGELDLRRGLR